jgi:hypothetical protein
MTGKASERRQRWNSDGRFFKTEDNMDMTTSVLNSIRYDSFAMQLLATRCQLSALSL